MTFILNTSTLGGSENATTKTTCEDRGNSLALDWTQSGFDQDLELYGFSIEFHPGEQVAYDARVTGTFGLFILDTSTLGILVQGYEDVTIEDRGRTMQITWSQSGFDQDLEIFGYGVRFAPAETEMASDTP